MENFKVSDGYLKFSVLKKIPVLLSIIIIVPALLALIVGGFVMPFRNDGVFRFPMLFFVMTVAIFILLGIVNLIYGIKWCRSFIFSIADDTVNVKGGVLSILDRTTNFQKITDVTIYQDIFGKWFGFATAGIQTAGSYIIEIIFFGVSYQDAVKIRDVICNKIGKKNP